MSATAAQGKPGAARRKWARIAGGLALLLLLLALALRVMLQPERVTRLVLDQVGKALGLEITASGASEYQLRGTPRLVLRDVVAREPGVEATVLRAERVLLSLPWSTIRARGAALDITRIELDAPVLDLAALQHWLATRPPGESRVPTLSDGLHVLDGRLDSDGRRGWHVEGIAITLPSLHPGKPVNARVKGRYVDAPTSIPFDLAVALGRPANDTGVALAGTLTVDRGSWRMPARIRLSGPLHVGEGGFQLRPARIAMSARYRGGDTNLPFVLGLHGPLRYANATWVLAPAGVALRGSGVLPSFDARAALAVGKRLVLRLDGSLPAWQDNWPALPAPVGRSDSPLPFELEYLGKADLSDIASLRLQRDDTRFDGRFRLFEVLAWIDAPAGGSPLPPLAGQLSTPRMEISGAQLEGVEILFDDASLGQPQPGTEATDAVR